MAVTQLASPHRACMPSALAASRPAGRVGLRNMSVVVHPRICVLHTKYGVFPW